MSLYQKILDWCDNASTLIGSEYIIMEHTEGVQLAERWPSMTRNQQISCIGNIIRKVMEVVNLTFPVYGNLYFADTLFESHHKVLLDEGFCIGPHCDAVYWDCSPGEPRYYQHAQPNQGPCESVVSAIDWRLTTFRV